MKLWLLRKIEDLNKDDNPWEPWYDTNKGFVIRAETEERARGIANHTRGSENSRGFVPWLDSKYSTCKELNISGEEGLIIRDFDAA